MFALAAPKNQSGDSRERNSASYLDTECANLRILIVTRWVGRPHRGPVTVAGMYFFNFNYGGLFVVPEFAGVIDGK